MDAEGLKEIFEPFGAVSVKRMFGGHGVYADGLCFALETDGEVYLKVDDQNRAEFEAAGSSPFTYLAKGKPMQVAYWRLVASAYDDPDELRRWSRLGHEAALRAAGAKAAKVAKSKRRPK
jgi:DNA transformation protein